MSKVIDLTGQKFGRLTVIKRQGSNAQGHATWRCKCECGKKVVCEGHQLRRGNTKSCGCYFIECTKRKFTKHGHSSSRLKPIWTSMKSRCYNTNNKNYNRYGGRGITVCDEWRNGFQAFYDWAMANGYDESVAYGKCTLDRIDNDRGYSPENCRWVDFKVQRNNRSDRRKV